MARAIASRRGLLKGAGLAGVGLGWPAASLAAGRADAAGPSDAPLQAILERYLGFGAKASGGPGDQACGAWIEQELTHQGYACRRQPFEVPFFNARQATLECGAARAEVVPQAIVAATGPQGLSAPLRLAGPGSDLAGAIALVVLPYKRWVSVAQPAAARPLAEALARGALGAVLVTTGPTGEAIALNVPMRQPPVGKPVAVLAPKDAAPFLAAAADGKVARLTLDGEGGGPSRRTAFNLIARLDRGAAKTVVVSTPRSGWFGCAAERGSGVAVWLSLAAWMARARHDVNVEFVANSGHEYGFYGAERYVAEAAPAPGSTRLWVAIGASAAARDWNAIGPRLLPLPSADSQRVLAATADLLPATRRAFRGITGLEAAYLADKAMAGGELTSVLDAGYRSAVGLYGIHRFFHTQADDLRCVSADLVAPVAAAYRRAVAAYLA